ncbi:hypothetical protein ABUW04_22105 [Streptacidiphilus sp. N1-10]|uniref:Uncharacterized protein n=1 Tax=Streptacidiphilus jeojiensis TaxID=3229225 RepID=A0ABV6XRT1_9ACTN
MMRMQPLAAIGAAVVCAVGLGAPMAVASSGGSAATITLSPTRLEPGQTVSIEVDCTAYNTPRPSGVSSQAFSSTVLLHPVAGALGHFSAAATIRTSVRPGSYTVAGSCQPDDARSSGFVTTLTVGRTETERPRREREGVVGPVRTGVGGSTYSASPGQIAAGAALVLGAGGTAVWRRRRAGRGGADGVS